MKAISDPSLGTTFVWVSFLVFKPESRTIPPLVEGANLVPVMDTEPETSVGTMPKSKAVVPAFSRTRREC
jgi:hypothetical protein